MTQNNNQILSINSIENKGQVGITGISRKLGALVAASVFVLSGCGYSPEELQKARAERETERVNFEKGSGPITFNVVPKELKDCKFFEINSWPADKAPISAKSILITRCPNSTTSTNYRESLGMTTVQRTTVVIDGEEYEKKSKK